MSVHVTDAVWQRSSAKKTDLLVLLAIADNANEETFEAWPSVETIARKARVDKRTAQRALRRLEAQGEIVVLRLGGRTSKGNRATVYRVELRGRRAATPGGSGAAGSASGGGANGHSGAAPVPPQPSKEPSKEPSETRARALTYRGKKVPHAETAAARHLLDVFNDATGRSLSAESHLRQIIGALLARPEVSTERWDQAIRRTVANPPSFVTGEVQLGHIFGEKAADHALSNKGRTGAGVVPTTGMCRNCNRRPRLTGSTHCGPCRDDLEAKLTGTAA